jgi:hypothetical protein
MVTQLHNHPRYHEKLQEHVNAVHQAELLHTLILVAFRLALAMACLLVEEVLNQRGREFGERRVCPQCGASLESRGLVERTMMSVIGRVTWKRRAWRCPQGCHLGLVAPLDEALGIQPQQRTSTELKRVACVLAVFVPYGIAAVLLKTLCGIEVSHGAIWDWVQWAGKDAMHRLEQELVQLRDHLPDADALSTAMAQLPLVLGGDGVMVPFRPQAGSAQGNNVWREVKVGIVARVGQRVTRTGRTVSVLARRRLVAVLGTIDEFQPRLWLSAVKEGLLHARMAVWLSDGGRGFWRAYADQFAFYAGGILDFYHASQHLWKAARAWLDGRTTQARTWFATARHKLRHGAAQEVLDDLRQAHLTPTLSAEVRKTLTNVIAYLETHRDHLDYEGYKEMGLPIGSGMVESVCKWLIQQRFTCVGMRWSEDGFNHLLHLRLAWVNGTFDDLFEHPVSTK